MTHGAISHRQPTTTTHQCAKTRRVCVTSCHLDLALATCSCLTFHLHVCPNVHVHCPFHWPLTILCFSHSSHNMRGFSRSMRDLILCEILASRFMRGCLKISQTPPKMAQIARPFTQIAPDDRLAPRPTLAPPLQPSQGSASCRCKTQVARAKSPEPEFTMV